jgi:hypothetical protein
MGSEDIVARSAIRFSQCAGMLTASLLLLIVSAGIAFADTGDATAPEPESPALTSKSNGNDSDSAAGAASNPDPPTSTVGNGRQDADVQTTEEGKNNSGATAATKKYKGSFAIPIFRIPRKDELPPSGLPNPSLFYTTLVIPVPTLGEFFAAMQPQPPTPAPGPAFRTQEEAPPVVDSGGGGVDPLSVGVAAEPPVLQAPLVIAPLPIPLSAPTSPVAPVVAADIAAAGARVPVIRGSLQPTSRQPTVDPATNAATPMRAEPMRADPTRLGYPRELRNPTAAELTVLALPGVVGLLLLTLSGGCIGYRQANSARLVRTQAADRFLR